MEFMLGGIIQFGGNFAPKDWAFCDGQLIAISQNQALFAILGTTWGGDGRTSFALPDLKGRVSVGTGKGPDLVERRLGSNFGAESVTLTETQLPAHTHNATFTPTTSTGTAITATVTVNAKVGTGDQNDAGSGYWATAKTGLPNVTQGFSSTTDTTMASDAVSVAISGGGGGITGGTVTNAVTGKGRGFAIYQPSLGMSSILALQGTFPSRN
ncbi:phage tail protein [Moritella dasanensis]|uniref:phage tail protein n=1 Tax=Moritella dasanensis TaxID=428031 RepID=UPI0003006674|nr:tail fiber protein [Moritella dasanensis]